jgi:hypothetical protein
MMAIEITKPEQILGQRVKLRFDMYKPDNWIYRYGHNWPGFEFGIVVEIQSWHQDRRKRIDRVNQVGLNLYNRVGHLYVHSNRAGIPQVAIVGFATNELILIREDGSYGDDLL